MNFNIRNKINDFSFSKTCCIILIILFSNFIAAEELNFHLFQIVWAQSSMLNYKNSTFGITMQYPASWQKDDLDTSNGAIVRFSSPLENVNDTYTENLEIHFVNLARGTTLENFTYALLQSYNSSLDNYTIISSNSTYIDGKQAHQLVFTASSDGYIYKALNIWSIIGNNALIAIYYAEPDKYATYLPAVSDMIDSIHLQPDVFGKPASGGAYVIPSLGFQIPFPTGWTNMDNMDNMTIFKQVPQDQTTSKNHVLLFGMLDGNKGLSYQFKSSSDSDLDCGVIQLASIVKLNETKAIESELQCDTGMHMKKIKFYMVASHGARIFIGYAASSESLYQKYLPDFEASIKGLELANPTDLSDLSQYSIFKLTTGRDQFEFNNTIHKIDFATSSTISDFHFDQNAKKLSFSTTVNEYINNSKKIKDETFLQINYLLRPTYVATIDNQITDENQPLFIFDTTTNRTLVNLNYVPGNHTIQISGSSVVPEYSYVVLILISAFALGLTIQINNQDFFNTFRKS